jgi:hypothetical protein
MDRRLSLCGCALTILLLASACAGLPGALGQLIQPPRFSEVDGRPAEIRLLPPSYESRAGGAAVRLWTAVRNPNPFGFTLSTLRGTLFLEGSRAATGDFPLGLPLDPGQETVIPIDLSISFADVPGLANVAQRAFTGAPIGYQFDGTVGIDAGRFGTPTFGPMTLLRGDIRTE